jgi:hypothetical protein
MPPYSAPHSQKPAARTRPPCQCHCTGPASIKHQGRNAFVPFVPERPGMICSVHGASAWTSRSPLLRQLAVCRHMHVCNGNVGRGCGFDTLMATRSFPFLKKGTHLSLAFHSYSSPFPLYFFFKKVGHGSHCDTQRAIPTLAGCRGGNGGAVGR